MRALNRVHNPVHQVRIFQNEIFWPTLESIYDVKKELAGLDAAENEILKNLIERHSLVDINDTMLRQRDLAAQKAEKQAEIDRKWNLIHAGCHFIAMLLNEKSDGIEAHLTPQQVYRTLASGDRSGMVLEALFA